MTKMADLVCAGKIKLVYEPMDKRANSANMASLSEDGGTAASATPSASIRVKTSIVIYSVAL